MCPEHTSLRRLLGKTLQSYSNQGARTWLLPAIVGSDIDYCFSWSRSLSQVKNAVNTGTHPLVNQIYVYMQPMLQFDFDGRADRGQSLPVFVGPDCTLPIPPWSLCSASSSNLQVTNHDQTLQKACLINVSMSTWYALWFWFDISWWPSSDLLPICRPGFFASGRQEIFLKAQLKVTDHRSSCTFSSGSFQIAAA